MKMSLSIGRRYMALKWSRFFAWFFHGRYGEPTCFGKAFVVTRLRIEFGCLREP